LNSRRKKSLWKCPECKHVYDRWRGDVPQKDRKCVHCQAKGGNK